MDIALKYQVRKGDTYSILAKLISECAGVTWEEIMNANPSINPKYLHPGQVINIPTVGGDRVLEYSVLGGTTYFDLSMDLKKCKGIRVKEIEEANPGVNPEQLVAGQVIQIPSAEIDEEALPAKEIIGYYSWTWSKFTTPPPGTILDIPFSGWVDPQQALSDSARIYRSLAGIKYICLGGGNKNGSWNSSVLDTIIEAIGKDDFSKYKGIVFDIELGDQGLAAKFQETFQATKKHNLGVIVTISHSAPFGFDDAPELMQELFKDENIDYLSPQLYTKGTETQNDYTISHGVTWCEYRNAHAGFVPSIVKADYYPDAVEYFKNLGISLAGYIQWAHTSH